MKYSVLSTSLVSLVLSAGLGLAQEVAAPPPQATSTGSSMRVEHNNRTDQVVVQNGPRMAISRSSSTARWGAAASRTLVIPQEAADSKAISEVEEDLNVMAHILNKAVSGDDKVARAMGITLYSRHFGSAPTPENLYVEGHGAIFFLDVNYPLLAPPTKEATTPAKERTSNEWEQARREISRTSPAYGAMGVGGGEDVFYGASGGGLSGSAVPAYDADKVEGLKKDLISALKNAAHIRRLKSDESVTVVVTSPGLVGDSKSGKVFAAAEEAYRRALVLQDQLGSPSDSNSAGKLILSAKKADAEAYQKGDLGYDEFRKKVSVVLY